MPDEYDYIIVGSGAGGSTLAYRLAQGGSDKILVIEYGPPDRNPMHRIPKGFYFTLNGNRYAYHYRAEAIQGNDSPEIWTRGKVAGGSTTVNGMMYSRGSEPDFEALASHAGATHWGWPRVLAAYRAMEDHELGESPMRGVGGPLGISTAKNDGELTERILLAGSALGWKRVSDLNDSDDERIGGTPSTLKNGRRVSAGSAFLKPALRRGRVRLLTHTRVVRILVREGKAYGVEARHKNSTLEFHARKVVIIAAGAVESPLLLERSGIGSPEVMRRLGLDVVVESPRVGERLIEQHSPATVQVRFNRRLGATEDLNTRIKQGFQGTKYLLTRRGEIATAGYDFSFHCKSSAELDRPDLYGAVSSFAIDPSAPKMKLADHSGMLIGMYQTRPETMSSVHTSSADPDAPPVISPRYFETETDAHAASRVLGLIREYVATGPLAEIINGEEFPSTAVSSDPANALEFARRRPGGTIYHAVGSCAMGPHDTDVVDDQLRVRGLEDLRVVDASVLPFQVSGNTAAPVMAVAWIAADLIAG